MSQEHSHEELWGGWVVAGRPGFPEAAVGHLLALHLVGISLSDQAIDLLFQLIDLLDELCLLVLQVVFLLHPLVPAGLGVPPVFQGSSLLFKANNIILGEAPQMPVELPDRHGNQLVIRESVFDLVG